MRNLLISILLLLTSCSYREVKNTDHSKINIEINNENEVRINGDLVAIDDLEQKLIHLKSKDTIKDENYTIFLDFDKNLDNEMVTTIKMQLRKANLLHIEYQSN